MKRALASLNQMITVRIFTNSGFLKVVISGGMPVGVTVGMMQLEVAAASEPTSDRPCSPGLAKVSRIDVKDSGVSAFAGTAKC